MKKTSIVTKGCDAQCHGNATYSGNSGRCPELPPLSRAGLKPHQPDGLTDPQSSPHTCVNQLFHEQDILREISDSRPEATEQGRARWLLQVSATTQSRPCLTRGHRLPPKAFRAAPGGRRARRLRKPPAPPRAALRGWLCPSGSGQGSLRHRCHH